MTAPKPASRAEAASLWRYFRLFRQDILSAQPARLYRAKMAEFRTPFFRSFLINQPDLIRKVLVDAPGSFPKSNRVTAGLAPLLGRSVFVTNGEEWERQRRIIDPVFSGGRVKEMLPQMLEAARQSAGRLRDGVWDVEQEMSRVTADIIFRTMFSRPIDDALATRVYQAFRTYQRSQPLMTPAAFLPVMPGVVRRRARRSAQEIRAALTALIAEKRKDLGDGLPVTDMVSRMMTAEDPETGEGFSDQELLDQVAIFFLAGHETSAATLSWALWLLAAHPETLQIAESEAESFIKAPGFSGLSGMPMIRNVIREALRLYPPVPMMVRQAQQSDVFRKRTIRPGDQIVISPWHMHRHEDHWPDPDAFRPERWDEPTPADCYLPFSSGPRICPGAGFALTEAAVILATYLSAARFDLTSDVPVPVAHLTVRSKDGISLRVTRRAPDSGAARKAG